MAPTKKSTKDKKPKTCRVCLSEKYKNHVTFDVDSEWSRLIGFCFEITIAPSSGGPRVLCDKCSAKLKDFSEFKTLALKSDTLWNGVLSSQIKTDPVHDKDIIVIKHEDEDCFTKQDDTESNQVVEYFDGEFADDVPDEDITEHTNEYVEIDIPVKDEPVDVETRITRRSKRTDVVENEIEKRAKTNKKQNKEKVNIAQEDLKGLSQNEFIKRYFEVFTTKKGKLKAVKYECLKCGDEIKRLSRLPLHVQKCHESEVLIVKNKNVQEKEKGKETDKTQYQYITPTIFECGLCEFKDNDEETVIKHLNEQHCLKNDLNCKLCDYVGRDMADVLTHRYKHMPPDKYRGKYRCPTCDKIRLNELCLQFHYRSLHLMKPGGWCDECNKTFGAYIYFRNHMRLHLEAKYICDFCGAKFLFRNLIEGHMMEHMNIRNYICDTCGKSFKRNNALTGHIRAYHTDLKPVPCDHCNKQFKNAYSLKLHMKMVKKGNNYICEVCCKGYPTMSLLKKHTFWHTGERPFSCETCGGKYKSKGNLKLHMRKHVGIYNYKCPVLSCEKPFLTSTQLKAHSSVHTGIRRVKCLVCDKTFHEKRQMLAHCQSKHESFMIKHEAQGTSLANSQVMEVPQSVIHM